VNKNTNVSKYITVVNATVWRNKTQPHSKQQTKSHRERLKNTWTPFSPNNHCVRLKHTEINITDYPNSPQMASLFIDFQMFS